MITRSYLIFEKGLIEEKGFPLENRLTIGRTKDSDIYLADRHVSRRHAVIYWGGRHAYVEDLGSRNGTFVNGERVNKSVLISGDILRIGTVTLQFVQDEPADDRVPLVDTEEMRQRDPSFRFDEKKLLLRSRRLKEVISRVPLFSDIGEEHWADVSQAAQLLVVNRGKNIVTQGDRGKSLYIILDGKARVFTYGNRGEEVPISYLVDNEFFGESPFFSGEPSASTVQAMEDTLLCTLSFEGIRNIVRRSAGMKGMLEKHYQESVRAMEALKKAAQMVERRRHPRFNEKLPVTFLFPPSSPVYDQFKGMFFDTISSDISLSGIRVKIQDPPLVGLPIGCELSLRVNLIRLRDFLRCMGTLRNIMKGKGELELGYMGIEFPKMPKDRLEKLERFLVD